MTTLSKIGVRRLAEAEQTIERGLSTFLDVGKALLSIRDDRLYRDTHDTFEAYCKARWALSKSRAYQLIDAAEVSTIVDVANEAQARALAPLKDDPEEAQAAFDEAKAEGNVTAASIARAVERRTAPANVDPETGEVLTPDEVTSPPAPLPAKDPVLTYRAKFSTERSKVRDGLFTFDVERAVATADERQALIDFANDLIQYGQKLLEAANGPRLSAVN